MQALNDQTAFTSVTHVLAVTLTMPSSPPPPPVVTTRQNVPGNTGTALLDSVTETRRFRALHALGLDAIRIRSSSIMDMGSGAGAAGSIPEGSLVRVIAAPAPATRSTPAGRCAADLHRLEQPLLAFASKPASGQADAPALLLDYTASGAEQALASDGQGHNVLMYAAMQGQLGVAEQLLAHRSAFAQAQALNEEGRNALMLAIAANHAPLARLFLAHPATAGQVIEVAPGGDDALIIAVRNGHREIVAMLLADPMAEILLDGATRGGVSALMLAALGGQADLLAMLLAAMSTEQANACDADGCNALMLAAQNGHAEVVRLLLADTRTAQQVFKSDLRGHNALVHATLAGSVAAVEALLGDSSGLAQAVAISQDTFNTMVMEVLKEGVENLFALAGVPMGRPGGARAAGKKRYTLKEVASYCPPRVVLTLLPIIARKIAEKRDD